MASESECLAKGQPALSGEAVLDDGTPEDQHVDPGISALRGSVARHAERRLDCRRPPRLDPGDTAGLQFGDDLVGDFGVKACAVVAGTDSSVSGHRSSPRRADGGLSSDLQPVAADPARTLTLSGGDAARTSGTAAHPYGSLCARDGSRRVKTREMGLQRSQQPGPAGRRRQATQVLGFGRLSIDPPAGRSKSRRFRCRLLPTECLLYRRQLLWQRAAIG
jgi:hypothetical protein